MSKEKLKPCPFCGSDAKLGTNFGRHSVDCKVCEVSIRSIHITGDGKDVVKAWNRRYKT